jgi:hypothetical protein
MGLLSIPMFFYNYIVFIIGEWPQNDIFFPCQVLQWRWYERSQPNKNDQKRL